MKVSVSDFEVRVMSFVKKVIKQPKEQLNRFAAGIAIVDKTKAIEDAIITRADSEGMIDLSELKKLAEAGFDASDGEIAIVIGHPILKMLGAQPEVVRISKEDADDFFASFA